MITTIAAAMIANSAVSQLGTRGHGTPTLLGLSAAGARLGYGAAKYIFERQRYKSDLARRLAEARRLTTPFSEQPDLVEFMRSQRKLPGPGQKLQNLSAAPLAPSLAPALEIATKPEPV